VEKVECQGPIVSPVKGSVEYLWDNIIFNIVQEVVPCKTEEEILGKGKYK
jgi:hypothetical protein